MAHKEEIPDDHASDHSGSAVWHGGTLYFDTGATQQKAINLRSNPRVVLTTGCNHWDRGLDVVVEGEAARVTDDDLLRQLAAI